jgi:hypothetical protein
MSPDVQDVDPHRVDDAARALAFAEQPAQVGRGKLPQVALAQHADAIGIGQPGVVVAADAARPEVDVRQRARPRRTRMRGNDLLQQGGARARHPDDEYRRIGRGAARHDIHGGAREHLGQAGDETLMGGGVVAAAPEPSGLLVVCESALVRAALVQQVADHEMARGTRRLLHEPGEPEQGLLAAAHRLQRARLRNLDAGRELWTLEQRVEQRECGVSPARNRQDPGESRGGGRVARIEFQRSFVSGDRHFQFAGHLVDRRQPAEDLRIFVARRDQPAIGRDRFVEPTEIVQGHGQRVLARAIRQLALDSCLQVRHCEVGAALVEKNPAEGKD